MKTFKTLLQREWLQHQRGWLVMLGLPVVLAVLLATFGQVELGDDTADIPGPLPFAVISVMAMVAVCLAITWGAALLMSPGLARRDTQDRSIEFWLSLPTTHVQSVSATLLMHLLALPWAAIGVGLAGGLLISPIIVSKGFGMAAWLGLPWADLLSAAAALWLRLSVGLVLATLWLSPLILGTMAASAWLKRWGVPAVASALIIGTVALSKLYGFTLLRDALAYITSQARRGFIGAGPAGSMPGLHIKHPDEFGVMLPQAAHWLMQDIGQALWAAATPGFVAALVVGAAAFAALILRRQRGA